MGVIKTREIANNNVELEITYGGLEAPFGGIDSSAPPAYIDPKCQTVLQGFVVIDNQLVAVSLQPLAITLHLPVTGFTTPLLSGFGNFYTQSAGYQNFALVIGDTTSMTGGFQTKLCLFVWPSSNTAIPAGIVFNFIQASTTAPATSATADVLFEPGPPGSSTTFINLISGNTVEPYSFPSTDTPSAMATAFAAAVTALPSVICSASVDVSGTSVTLTTIATGAVANSTHISFGIVPSLGTYATLNAGFQGGINAYNYPTAVPPSPLSFVSEGENLYLSGGGCTAIFQYVNGVFSLASQYVGAATLKKFGGSLLALGINPSPGTVIASPEMVVAWSVAGNFSTWNPLNSSGNVTGAGFDQLEDIEDIINGGFVNNSTLFILRAKGISYGTVTGNSVLPFNFSHVDLAPEGEGCQNSVLNSQYGAAGFFVGNSNVYSFVQSMQPIGEKIKNQLFPLLSPTLSEPNVSAGSKAISLFMLGTETLFYAIYAGSSIFMYNASNGTWGSVNAVSDIGYGNGIQGLVLENWPVLGTPNFYIPWQKQSQLVFGALSTVATPAGFYKVAEAVQNSVSPTSSITTVVFPQEEISFGRDITIDGLYVKIAGTAGQIINWQITDSQTGSIILQGSLTLPVGASYNTYTDYQLFDSTTGSCTGTGKAPQLQISVPTNAGSTLNQLRIAKVSKFGSYDPTQRPV